MTNNFQKPLPNTITFLRQIPNDTQHKIQNPDSLFFSFSSLQFFLSNQTDSKARGKLQPQATINSYKLPLPQLHITNQITQSFTTIHKIELIESNQNKSHNKPMS
jgi:hypothetical protein